MNRRNFFALLTGLPLVAARPLAEVVFTGKPYLRSSFLKSAIISEDGLTLSIEAVAEQDTMDKIFKVLELV